MLERSVKHLRRNLVAYLALLVALSGTSYAAVTLPQNSVGSKQIKNRSIQRIDIGRKTIASLKGQRGLRGVQGPEGPPNPNAVNAQHATNADHAATAEQATLAQSTAGRFTSLFVNRSGPLPLSATFTSSGRPLLIELSGSAFANNASEQLAVTASIDGIQRGEARGYANEVSSHKALPTESFVVTGLPAGPHTLALNAVVGGGPTDTNTDSNDFFSVSMLELPTAFALGPDGREPDDGQATGTVVCFLTSFGTPYLFGTIWPAGNDDWVKTTCGYSTGTATFTLVGGPTMDVYATPYNGTPLAQNVTTFTAPNTTQYILRLHSVTAAAYTLRELFSAGP